MRARKFLLLVAAVVALSDLSAQRIFHPGGPPVGDPEPPEQPAQDVFYDEFLNTTGSNVDLAAHDPITGDSWAEVIDTCGSGSVINANINDYAQAGTSCSDARIVYKALPSPAIAGQDYDVEIRAASVSTTVADRPGSFIFGAQGSNFGGVGSEDFCGCAFYGGSASTDLACFKMNNGARSDIVGGTSSTANPTTGDEYLLEARGDDFVLKRGAETLLAFSDAFCALGNGVGIAFGNVRSASDDIAGSSFRWDDFRVRTAGTSIPNVPPSIAWVSPPLSEPHTTTATSVTITGTASPGSVALAGVTVTCTGANAVTDAPTSGTAANWSYNYSLANTGTSTCYARALDINGLPATTPLVDIIRQSASASAPVMSDWTPTTQPYDVPSNSPFDAYVDVSFKCTDDVTCVVSTARWENPDIYNLTADATHPIGSAEYGTCSGNTAGVPVKTINCNGIRIGPFGTTNTVQFWIKDGDGNETTATRTFTNYIPMKWITGGTLPDAVTGQFYQWPIKCAQGKPPYTYSIASGALPAGMSLNSSSGLISGTHAGSTTANFAARCVDSLGAAPANQSMTVIVGAAPASGPHDYWNIMNARPDKFANGTKSLRNATEVNALVTPQRSPNYISYNPAGDTDVRKQDATKVLVLEAKAGPGPLSGGNQQMHIDIGPSLGQSVFFGLDAWFGDEWNHWNSQTEDIKGTPYLFEWGGQLWGGMRMKWQEAHVNEATLPAGGPFVGMTFAQATGKCPMTNPLTPGQTPISWTEGYCGPEVYLPANIATSLGRHYAESIAPIDTSISAAGGELGVVGGRWTRIWHYFERSPADDFTWLWDPSNSTYYGVEMTAYKWTMWLADTKRPAIRYMNNVVVGIRADYANQLTGVRVEFAPGNSVRATMYKGRGTLTAYYRNAFTLHGVNRATVETLLTQPVPEPGR